MSQPLRYCNTLVLGFAAAIFVGCIISPPSLMDDVDAVQAQIARNMLDSGDWVSARLNGIAYMEKAPLKYWMIAASYMIFGVHDWAARLPIALSAVLLVWVTARFGAWAFGEQAGVHAGLSLATCVGLFLFTRVLIPDVILTLFVTLAIWSFIKAVDGGRRHAFAMWAAMAAGVLTKGLIGVLFPAAIGSLYLLLSRRAFQRETWSRLHPVTGVLLFLAIAAPWHVLATLRNPPWLDFTMHSESGSYHGFFWSYFVNEHLLRFLNRRYPRDYDTVPRLYFWLSHLLWLFPWSVYLPAVAARRDFRRGVPLLAACWIGFVLLFFTLSTSQEYYSMPCYPAFALLIGRELAQGGKLVRLGTRVAAAVSAAALVVILVILWMVRSTPAKGDIASALRQNPELYTLSLGHMTDLTLGAFAYLRLPLAMAAVGLAVGAWGAWRLQERKAVLSLAVMMVLFCHAARLALVVFDPYLSTRRLGEALRSAPEGTLVVNNPYWEFSSVFFYANRSGLMLNGRRNNLEYGSYASGAPRVFIDDAEFMRLWRSPGRCYLVTEGPKLPRLEQLVGNNAMHALAASGGKLLLTNRERPYLGETRKSSK